MKQVDEEMYNMSGGPDGEDKYLIATSEQPICGYHANKWLEKSLPIRYSGEYFSVWLNRMFFGFCEFYAWVLLVLLEKVEILALSLSFSSVHPCVTQSEFSNYLI